MKKTKKISKFRLAGLIALITGGLIAGGVTYTKHMDSEKIPEKKEIRIDSSFSVEQMQKMIKQADMLLAKLKKTIDSKKTDPEARFEARRIYKDVLKERASLQKKLDEAIKRQKATIKFNNTMHNPR